MPRAERPTPLFRQIADHYRALIRDEHLREGQQLPSVVDLIAEWDVGRDTAAKALGQLQVEGIVWTSANGTFVAGNEAITTSPRDRVRVSRTMEGPEEVTVTEAGALVPPVYVAELLGIAPGIMVIRRETVASRHRRPIRLTVDWIPPLGQLDSGELLAPLPVLGGVVAFVERATGRHAGHGQDHLRGRASDQREAGHLGLRIGTPILAVVSLFSDDEGVLVYEESCLPPDLTFLYDYELGDDD